MTLIGSWLLDSFLFYTVHPRNEILMFGMCIPRHSKGREGRLDASRTSWGWAFLLPSECSKGWKSVQQPFLFESLRSQCCVGRRVALHRGLANRFARRQSRPKAAGSPYQDPGPEHAKGEKCIGLNLLRGHVDDSWWRGSWITGWLWNDPSALRIQEEFPGRPASPETWGLGLAFVKKTEGTLDKMRCKKTAAVDEVRWGTVWYGWYRAKFSWHFPRQFTSKCLLWDRGDGSCQGNSQRCLGGTDQSSWLADTQRPCTICIGRAYLEAWLCQDDDTQGMEPPWGPLKFRQEKIKCQWQSTIHCIDSF